MPIFNIQGSKIVKTYSASSSSSNKLKDVQYLPISHIREMALEKNGILHVKTDYSEAKLVYENDKKVMNLCVKLWRELNIRLTKLCIFDLPYNNLKQLILN